MRIALVLVCALVVLGLCGAAVLIVAAAVRAYREARRCGF